MTGEPTTIDDHDQFSYDILQVLEEFIDEIGRRSCTAHFDKVIVDKYELHGRYLVQEPERFIEDHLVFPILGVFWVGLLRYGWPWPETDCFRCGDS